MRLVVDASVAAKWLVAEDGADAVRLALALDRPVYDCVYLALAHRLGARMVTADARFANTLASTEHDDAVTMLADRARVRPPGDEDRSLEEK